MQRFTEMGEQWQRIILSGEFKLNLKGSDSKRKVRRPVGKRLQPIYTIGTVKHGSGKGLKVWGCFSGFSGLGPLYCIEDIMDKYI